MPGLYPFGAGLFVIVPNVANATPVRFTPQEVTLDFKGESKVLYGSEGLPLAAARGKVSVSGKVTNSGVSIAQYNAMFFGNTLTTGQTLVQDREAAAVPASTPFTCTVANAATFGIDLGVLNAATGVPLTKVASGTTPTTGQYSVSNAGVYTFAAADTGLALLITYSYTVAGQGVTFTINNQPMGTSPMFKAVYQGVFQPTGKKAFWQLNACIAHNVQQASKIDDFMLPAFEFQAMVDAADVLGIMSGAE
jgi:hypothetical protein